MDTSSDPFGMMLALRRARWLSRKNLVLYKTTTQRGPVGTYLTLGKLGASSMVLGREQKHHVRLHSPILPYGAALRLVLWTSGHRTTLPKGGAFLQHTIPKAA